jgi:hypothetical protein
MSLLSAAEFPEPSGVDQVSVSTGEVEKAGATYATEDSVSRGTSQLKGSTEACAGNRHSITNGRSTLQLLQ